MSNISMTEMFRLVTDLRENADEKKNVTFRTHALNHKAATVIEQLLEDKLRLTEALVASAERNNDES